MKWIEVPENLPSQEGKYVVKTKSKYRTNVLEVSFHFDKNKKPVWACNNQIVTHFLNYEQHERKTKTTADTDY